MNDLLLDAAHCIARCWTLIRTMHEERQVPVESMAEIKQIEQLLHDCDAVLLRINYPDAHALRDELMRRLMERGALHQYEIELLKSTIKLGEQRG